MARRSSPPPVVFSPRVEEVPGSFPSGASVCSFLSPLSGPLYLRKFALILVFLFQKACFFGDRSQDHFPYGPRPFADPARPVKRVSPLLTKRNCVSDHSSPMSMFSPIRIECLMTCARVPKPANASPPLYLYTQLLWITRLF